MTPPAPPPTSPSVHESDAFHRVGRALIASWPQWSTAPESGDRATISARQRNRLLDETGSDFRPLVDLLIDLGHTTRPALQRIAHAPLSASAWDTARAPIVHQIVSTRYLQPDVARWAVDVWGRALGVSPVPITREQVAAPQVRTAEMVPYAAPTAGAVAAAANATLAKATARFGTLPPLLTTSRSVPKPARPNAPSWAGGPASFGVGARVKPGARAALAKSGRLLSNAPRVQGPKYQPVERFAAVVLGGILLIVVSMAMWRKFSAPLSADRASSVDARPAATAPRVAATAAMPYPVSSELGSSLTQPIVAQRTPDTSVVSPATTPDLPLVSPMVAGVAGRYRVTQRIRSVDGSASCESVSSALGVGRESEERITHVPGSATFRIASRGVAGTLDGEGLFVAGPLSGTTNNIPWQFQMRGRFSANGFTGVSETYTRAIIRWGRTQSCVVTADLSAIRLPD